MPEGTRAGRHVHWRTGGQGDRSAVLAHCSLAHAGALKGLMTALDDRLTMWAFDQPGHGASGDWRAGDPFQDAVVAIARTFRDEVAGPVDLIGHSFGGTALLQLAVEAPSRVRSLTLIEPPFYPAAEGTPAAERQAELDRPFRAAAAEGDMATAAERFMAIWGTPWATTTPAQRDYAIARMPIVAQGGEGLNADRGDILAPGRLERLTAPVLLVQGETTTAIVPAILDHLGERLPDSRRRVISGAGHMAPVTHPEAVAAEIRELLDAA